MKKEEKSEVKMALRIVRNHMDYISIDRDGDCVLDGNFTIKELEAVLTLSKARVECSSMTEFERRLK